MLMSTLVIDKLDTIIADVRTVHRQSIVRFKITDCKKLFIVIIISAYIRPTRFFLAIWVGLVTPGTPLNRFVGLKFPHDILRKALGKLQM